METLQFKVCEYKLNKNNATLHKVHGHGTAINYKKTQLNKLTKENVMLVI